MKEQASTVKRIYTELLATATPQPKIDSIPLYQVHPGCVHVHIQTALKGATRLEAMNIIQLLFTAAAAELNCDHDTVVLGGDARKGTFFSTTRMETQAEVERRLLYEAELQANRLQREERKKADRQKQIAKLEKEIIALKSQSQSK
jgi:hypothetical protein